jgi:protein-tyrosine phosphatase
MGFVDLHSHVLPGLDDGARTTNDAVEMATLLAHLGFEIVCATPHQKHGWFAPSSEAIDTAWHEIKGLLEEKQVPIELRLGAENFWDELFLSRAQRTPAAQPTYTGGRAFLVELNVAVAPPRLEETLFHYRSRGLLPVLAHPERYRPLRDDRQRLAALARTAALVVDLGALDGAHGAEEARAAQRLVRDGLAHACASDVHLPSDARAVAAGIAWIKKKLGPAAVTRLLADNPRQILQGELPD